MLTPIDATRRALSLEAFYGKEEAFRIAASRKAESYWSRQSRDSRGRFGPLEYPCLDPLMANFWADVELALMAESLSADLWNLTLMAEKN